MQTNKCRFKRGLNSEIYGLHRLLLLCLPLLAQLKGYWAPDYKVFVRFFLLHIFRHAARSHANTGLLSDEASCRNIIVL